VTLIHVGYYHSFWVSLQPVLVCIGLVLAGAAERTTDTSPTNSSPRNGLHITSATRERIRGRLTNGSIGVSFDSWREGSHLFLELKTLQGKELLSIKEHGDYIITSVDDGRLSTRTRKADLLQLRGARSSGGRAAVKDKLAKLQHEAVENARRQIGATTKARGGPRAVRRARPEYELLPSLSFELGKIGLTGHRYPPSVAIHSAARLAGQVLGIDPRKSNVVYRQQLPSHLREARAALDKLRNPGKGEVVYDDCPKPPRPPEQHQSSNLDPRRVAPNQVLDRNTKPWLDLLECGPPAPCKAYPNRGYDCFGMCGPDCDAPCWDWVCGDCCYHDFCAAHDAAIRACEAPSEVVLSDKAALLNCAIVTSPTLAGALSCVDNLLDTVLPPW
jgi:hypothetical protein